MGIILNKKLDQSEKERYENNIKTYSGFFNNYFEIKTTSSVTSTTVFKSITSHSTNGYTIAISESPSSGNNILTSSDGGETWSSHKISETITFNKIIYANGKYIAVGNSGKIIYSTVEKPSQTSHWTIITTSPTSNWNSITYGNGYYIIISNTGVMVSSNGISWTSKTIYSSTTWKDICYSDDLKTFVVISSSNFSAYSRYNGDEWTLINTVPSGGWNSIIWSSKIKKFVSVAGSGDNRIVYSSDGITWTALSDSSLSQNWTNLIWSQELEIFVAVSTSGKIATSPDSLKWTFRTSPSSNYQQISWNRYFGNLIIISSNATSSKIIFNKNLGINNLLPAKKYYYDYQEDSFSYSLSDILILIDDTIKIYSTLNENLGFIYSISPSLPTGITLNTSTGEIIGSTLNSLDRTKFKITATNSSKTLKANVYLTVSSTVIPLSSFYYVANNVFSVDIGSIFSLTPKIFGSSPITYSSIGTNSLPNTITLDPSSGIISGIAPITSSNLLYIIKAQNSLNSINNTINIRFNDKPIDNFNYNSGSNAIVTVNTFIEYFPSENNGTNIIYTISPTLISGLSINSSTGRIFGTTPVNPTQVLYTITATNNNNTQSKTTNFLIGVVDIPIEDFSYNNGSNFYEVDDFGAFNLTPYPSTNAGTNISSWTINPSLPSGLSLTGTGNTGGRISGNPTTYSSKYYTISAINTRGTVNTVIGLRNNFTAVITTGSYSSSNFTKGFGSPTLGSSMTKNYFNTIQILSILCRYTNTNGAPIDFVIIFNTTNLSLINLDSVIINNNNVSKVFYSSDATILSGNTNVTYSWTAASGKLSSSNQPFSPNTSVEQPLIKLVQNIT